jgi:hypothetical protein
MFFGKKGLGGESEFFGFSSSVLNLQLFMKGGCDMLRI